MSSVSRVRVGKREGSTVPRVVTAKRMDILVTCEDGSELKEFEMYEVIGSGPIHCRVSWASDERASSCQNVVFACSQK